MHPLEISCMQTMGIQTSVIFTKRRFFSSLSRPLKSRCPNFIIRFLGGPGSSPSPPRPLSSAMLCCFTPDCVPFICHSPLAVWEEQTVMDANHFSGVPIHPTAYPASSAQASPFSPMNKWAALLISNTTVTVSNAPVLITVDSRQSLHRMSNTHFKIWKTNKKCTCICFF